MTMQENPPAAESPGTTPGSGVVTERTLVPESPISSQPTEVTRSRRRTVLLPRDLGLIALFAALIATLGFVAVPVAGMAVPIVLQNLGVFLAGAILGARRGTLAIVTFLVLVAAGLPLLSGGRGGIGVFMTPSLGYLLGWVAGAFVIGFLTERIGAGKRYFPKVLAAVMLGGVLVIDLLGALVSPLFTGLDLGVTLIGSAVFLPGDILKAVLAALVAAAVHRAYPVPPVGIRRGESGA
ncbi:MAG: biotin transporter BioY [Arthrobacter sp.]|jgi:biotin transport system substrate-specific component|nr:biotin transporter BioY [Arthrobacter sp.]MCU1541868.1 biotin transporter BioY [Arthrobacter sp.]MCU1555401.1 biotin transporter BioY [Arthrobacter sp.]